MQPPAPTAKVVRNLVASWRSRASRRADGHTMHTRRTDASSAFASVRVFRDHRGGCNPDGYAFLQNESRHHQGFGWMMR